MKRHVAGAAIATLALTLAACSPSTDKSANEESGADKGTETSAGADSSDAESGAAADGEKTTVTFRLWDENAVESYEQSFAAFEAENPDINVEIEQIPWGTYWEQLPLDISADQMADIYLVNSSNFALYADNGNLMNITEELGNDHAEWQQSVVDLYTRDGSLWGVPQLWDSVALFYNKDMVEEAGVDVKNLTWAPEGSEETDTLLAAAQELTVDAAGKKASEEGFDAATTKVYGFNAQNDMQAIYLSFLAENGSQFQNDGGMFAFDNPEGAQAFQYLADMVNKYKVAPPASETNTNGDITGDMFIRGELALYQTGPYNLKKVADNTDINWGIAPKVAGPEGRMGVVHGVVAVGNEQTKNREETVRVLEWLGSPEGQLPLAENGIAFPGAVEAQEAFVNYWAEQGVDVSVFIDAASGDTVPAPVGPDVNAGTIEVTPYFMDIFLGTLDPAEGLATAQEAGNSVMK